MLNYLCTTKSQNTLSVVPSHVSGPSSKIVGRWLVMLIFGTMSSAVSLQLLAIMVAATHIHPYSRCVPASTPTPPTRPVLAHGRSSLGQCWLSKESDALTYIHLFQVVLHPAIGQGTHGTGSMCVSRLCKSLEPSPDTCPFTVCPAPLTFPCRLPGVHH